LAFRAEPTNGPTRSPLQFNGSGQYLSSLSPHSLQVSQTFISGPDDSLSLRMIFIESPWWLVRSGRLAEAERAITRLGGSGDGFDPSKSVALMVRTNQHEKENAEGTSFFVSSQTWVSLWLLTHVFTQDCLRGSDLRRTEVACVGWAIQVLSGSSFGNQGTYFFEQGMFRLQTLYQAGKTDADFLTAGLSTSDSFKFNLGQYAIGFCGTCASWITMTVSRNLLANDTSIFST
jgi:SP family general alpha glucoside:H+ symporter-like MFS transporter